MSEGCGTNGSTNKQDQVGDTTPIHVWKGRETYDEGEAQREGAEEHPAPRVRSTQRLHDIDGQHSLLRRDAGGGGADF